MRFSADMHDPTLVPAEAPADDGTSGTIMVGESALKNGDWVEVVTDYGHSLHGFARHLNRRRPAVGCVTYIAEDGKGFEITTGATSAFKLSEIRMRSVSSLRKVRRPADHERHGGGFIDARARQADAERKKMTREKREGMFR